MLWLLKTRYIFTWFYIYVLVFIFQVIGGACYFLMLLSIEPEYFGLLSLGDLVLAYAHQVEQENIQLLNKIVSLLDEQQNT